MATSISYQGEPGAFSEQAARVIFGAHAKLIPREHFRDVFLSVVQGRSRYGIIPIENSVFGSVHENYDLLLKYPLMIAGEVTLRIRHQLLALRGVKRRDLRFVFSHPQALGQCEEFLHGMKGVKAMAYYDTAGAAKMIREEQRRNAAAIASVQAARTYKLKILTRNIEGNRQNFTRFLVLARGVRPSGGPMKTSLVFSARNIPGSLFKALAVFALREINLLKIESRPLPGRPWEYHFYLDVMGSIQEEKLRQALNHLEEVCTFVRVLGSYPPGKTVKG